MSLQVETFARVEEADASCTGTGACYLGGGTLVMRAINHGDPMFRRIVRCTDPRLKLAETSGGQVRLGAGVTMAEILAHRDLADLAPAARAVGGPAVRNMATVGGNLCAGHPYGDFAVALLALDAAVELAGDGRELPLAEFLAPGGGERSRLVRAVRFARPLAGSFRFRKASRTHPKGISILSMAALLPVSGGRVRGARIACGAMGPVPVRMPAAERALEGCALDEAGVRGAVEAATDGLDPPTDALASGWYRREVAPVHMRRMLLGEGSGS